MTRGKRRNISLPDTHFKKKKAGRKTRDKKRVPGTWMENNHSNTLSTNSRLLFIERDFDEIELRRRRGNRRTSSKKKRRKDPPLPFSHNPPLFGGRGETTAVVYIIIITVNSK